MRRISYTHEHEFLQFLFLAKTAENAAVEFKGYEPSILIRDSLCQGREKRETKNDI